MRRLINKRSSTGFTLIELVIVVVMVGILGAVLIPAYPRYTAAAMNAAGSAWVAEYNNAVVSVCALGGPTTVPNLQNISQYLVTPVIAGTPSVSFGGGMAISITDGSGTCASPTYPVLTLQGVGTSGGTYFTTIPTLTAGPSGTYIWTNGVI